MTNFTNLQTSEIIQFTQYIYIYKIHIRVDLKCGSIS